MRSVFFRYFFRSSLLLMASVLVLGLALVSGASSVLERQQEEEMRKTAKEVAKYVMVYFDEIRFSAPIGVAVTTIGNITSFHVCVMSVDGLVLLTSDAPGTGYVGQYLPEQVVQSSLNGESVKPRQLNGFFGHVEKAETCAILTPDGRTAGAVLISTDTASYRGMMAGFLQTWLTTSLIILFISCMLAYYNARRLSRPLRQMAACAHSFAHGDFSIRVPDARAGDGESTELSYAFNAMADALSNAEELRRGFIANVSHELKTPMTTISGFLGGILDGTIPPEHHEETIRLVREEVMRLSRMVSSMTNLSRLQTGQLDVKVKSFDIGELALRVLLSFEAKINDRGLLVEINIAEGEGLMVTADPDSIVQVLTNLLDNAVKFSERGGTLELAIYAKGGKAHISVKNGGAGIPEKDLPYIFDRYHKADRSRSADRSGLGLGLFIVKSILNAHNEDIHVSSESGETVFTFTLTETKGSRRQPDSAGV